MISPIKLWRRQKRTTSLLDKKGKVLTWTEISVAGTEHKDMTPYIVLLVELEDGSRVPGQLVAMIDEKIKIGDKVQTALRKVRHSEHEGVINYGIKFRKI